MRKNKNKPETVDTASVTETEEIKVPKKKKKKTGLIVFLIILSRRSGSILFHGTSETDLHNQELSRKCSGNEL